MGVLILGLHIVGLVSYVILLRQSALEGVSPYALILSLQVASLVVAVALLSVGLLELNLSALSITSGVTLVLGSLAVVTYMILSVVSLEKMEASSFALVFNSRLLFTTILGIVFLSEIPTMWQALGGLVIFAAIGVLHLDRAALTDKSALWGFLTAITFSIHAIFEKFNVETLGLGTHVPIALMLNIFLLTILCLYSQVTKTEYKEILRFNNVAVIGARLLSGWMYVVAVTLFPVAVVNYISGLGVIAITVAGVLFLQERDNLTQKFLAVLISIMGLTMILFSATS